MKLLETEWVNCRNKVIPKNAGETQLTEMRRAFYAGAWSLYTLLMENLSEGPDSEQKDVDLLAKLHVELMDFRDRVRKGFA